MQGSLDGLLMDCKSCQLSVILVAYILFATPEFNSICTNWEYTLYVHEGYVSQEFKRYIVQFLFFFFLSFFSSFLLNKNDALNKSI